MMIDRYRKQFGFTLTELLAAMVIAALILTASMGIYNQMNSTSARIQRKIEVDQLPVEILQRIAEDIDSIISPNNKNAGNTTIEIKNKVDEIYQTAQLIITRTYYDRDDKPQVYDKITWQGNYDYYSNSLIIYRSYQGLNFEDKLLGGEKEQWKRELFIPVAEGVTFFSIEALSKGEYVDKWTDTKTLPKAVKVSLSMTAPVIAQDGDIQIFEDDLIVRTIVVDRTGNIKFKSPAPDLSGFFGDFNDANGLNDMNDFDSDNFDTNEAGNF